MSNVLDRLDAMLAGLDEAQTAELDGVLAEELSKPWLPTPGPQLEAFLSEADLMLYGGAAGGGKTDLICGLALTAHRETVVFRRLASDLKGFWKRLTQLCPNPVRKNDNEKTLSTVDGRSIECGHLDAPGSEMSWQGRDHDLICFDEGAQLTSFKVKFVMAWLRTSKPGQRCRAVIASNPPIGSGGAWLMEWFAPWLDPLFPNPALPGELRWAVAVGGSDEIKTVWTDGPEPIMIEGESYTPLSRTFVPSKLNDNPYLNPEYGAHLQSMPEPLRSKLLKGDFLSGGEDHQWQVIPSAWVEAAQARWKPDKPDGVPMTNLGVDVAQGGADKTVLAPLYSTWFDKLSVHKGVDTKDGPAVAGLIVTTMRDGCQINIDMTGGWGISARDQLAANNIRTNGIVFSAGSDERTANGKLGFYNLRAELWWRFREALDPFGGHNIALPPGATLKAQLTSPHWKPKGDKIVIESKDEIRKRLGSSTDEGDAVVMAWHRRDMSMFWREHMSGKAFEAVPAQDPFDY